MKRLVKWTVILLAAAAGGYFMFQPQPMLVELGKPEIRTVREYIAEEAKTRLDEEYIIDVPVSLGNTGFLPSTVESLTLEVGDVVEKGQVIARLDARNLMQDITSTEAMIAQNKARIEGVEIGKPKTEDLASAALRVEEARNALKIAEHEAEIASIEERDAKKAYDRAAGLLAEHVVSTADFDSADQRYKAATQNVARTQLAAESARKALEIAQLQEKRLTESVDDNEYQRKIYASEIEQLESRLAMLRSDLEKTEIRAPVAGPILEKYIENPRVLSPGSPLVKLGDLDSIEIECDVLSEEVVNVEPEAKVEISGKALGGNTIPGQVKRVYPSAFKKISSLGIEQQRVKVLIGFDNSEIKLRAGTRVDVKIITAEAANAIAVPERSTFRRKGVWNVFAVKNGRAIETPVTLGVKNDDWAQISEGLDADADIVLEPGNELADGAHVAPRE